MFLCNDIAIKLVFSIILLSSTGNDNKSINAEHGFESSFATNNNIVCDVNEEHNADSDVYKIDPFVDLNTSKQCFLTLKKNKSSFKLHNLTGETRKQNLTAERRNQVSKQVFSQTFFLWGGGGVATILYSNHLYLY